MASGLNSIGCRDLRDLIPPLCGTKKISEFYQIYYHDSQIEKLYPFAIPYFNETLTIFFENSVIKDVVMSTESPKASNRS